MTEKDSANRQGKSQEARDQDNRELMKHRWKNLDDTGLKSLELTIGFGVQAIRSAGVANAAVTALFVGFLSATTARIKSASVLVEGTLYVLFTGIVLSAFALGSSYLAQFFYTLDRNDHEKTVEWPYFEMGTKRHGIIAGFFHFMAVLAVLSSLLCFIKGVVGVLDVVRIALLI